MSKVSRYAHGGGTGESGAVDSEGQGGARKLARARILLKADSGPGGPDWGDATIAESLEVGIATLGDT